MPAPWRTPASGSRAVSPVPAEGAIPSRHERQERGRALRAFVPRSVHADWTPGPDRPDPVQALVAQAATRVPELLPIRYGRMLASPFAFLRGSAAVMAIDLGTLPVTGITVQTSGDAHIANFGEFATPERNVVFDLNDFDETLPGPWEWDIKRLAASLAVVARQLTFTPPQAAEVVIDTVRSYRRHILRSAALRVLDRWYMQIDADDVIAHFPAVYRPLVRRDLEKARSRNQHRAVTKLTERVDGTRRFVERPPLIVHLHRTEHDTDEVSGMLDSYRATVDDERRSLFDAFTLVDVARKVVGVGSVGTRCWVALFQGPDHADGDFLVLQVKEAGPSVLEPYVGRSEFGHHGQRVVCGQRRIQAASDVFLGWCAGPQTGRDYYVRQLWDIKGQGDPLSMNPDTLARYGELCARALARAHARTGDPSLLAGYLGKSDQFDRAMAEFAHRYALQTEADHAALTDAYKAGDIDATPGI